MTGIQGDRKLMVVILNEVKNLLVAEEILLDFEILRFAQDDRYSG
jgi:hypothetical protein